MNRLMLFVFLNFVLVNSKEFSDDNKILICNTIPKSGTFLIVRCLEILVNKSHYNYNIINKELALSNQHILFSHFNYNEENKKILKEININNSLVNFFIIRDPRDQLISFIYWGLKTIKEEQSYYKIEKLIPGERNFLVYNYLSMDEILMSLIYYGTYWFGFNVTNGIKSFYDSFLGWIDNEESIKENNICVIKFENLIGSKGGGDDNLQYLEIKKIANKIGITLDDDQVKEVSQKLFGNTYSFRQGQIGNWKKYFKKEHKDAFKAVAGDLLIKLGYEKDLNW